MAVNHFDGASGVGPNSNNAFVRRALIFGQFTDQPAGTGIGLFCAKQGARAAFNCSLVPRDDRPMDPHPFRDRCQAHLIDLPELRPVQCLGIAHLGTFVANPQFDCAMPQALHQRLRHFRQRLRRVSHLCSNCHRPRARPLGQNWGHQVIHRIKQNRNNRTIYLVHKYPWNCLWSTL